MRCPHATLIRPTGDGYFFVSVLSKSRSTSAVHFATGTFDPPTQLPVFRLVDDKSAVVARGE